MLTSVDHLLGVGAESRCSSVAAEAVLPAVLEKPKTLVKDIDPLPILARFEAGESVRAIAQSLGCSNVALYKHLIAKVPEQWKELASASALADLDEADDELKGAQDTLSVARARARTELYRWKLERLLRRYFGQDVPAQAQAVQININLRRENATNAAQHEAIDVTSESQD